MIKEIFDFAEGFITTISSPVQQVIRKEVEYNMQVFQEGISKAVEKSVDYVKKELTYLAMMLSAFLLGMMFIAYGASVFLDKVFFNSGGVGFILVGAFLLFIALMLGITRRR